MSSFHFHLTLKFKKALSNRFFWLKAKRYFNDDQKYLIILYKHFFGTIPNLTQPRTFNEKLLWLKLFWRDNRCYELSDKYRVRKYIESLGLSEILIPLYGVYTTIKQINFQQLPNEFIIKTTHDSGGTYIVRDKSNPKIIKGAIHRIKWSLKRGVYNKLKEWTYEKPDRKIVVEKLIKDPNHEALIDYKFFCFHGKAKFLFVATERNIDVKFDFFDLDWNWFNLKNGHENNKVRPIRPKNFEKMIEIAEKISGDFPHVRIDLYNVNCHMTN